jgi:hypothetical protein
MTKLQARVHVATKSVLTHGSRRLICVEDQEREGEFILAVAFMLFTLVKNTMIFLCSVSHSVTTSWFGYVD